MNGLWFLAGFDAARLLDFGKRFQRKTDRHRMEIVRLGTQLNENNYRITSPLRYDHTDQLDQ